MNKTNPTPTKPNNWEAEFDEIGFGNQMRVPGGKYGAKRVELKTFIFHLLQESRREVIESMIKSLPKGKSPIKDIAPLINHNQDMNPENYNPFDDYALGWNDCLDQISRGLGGLEISGKK